MHSTLKLEIKGTLEQIQAIELALWSENPSLSFLGIKAAGREMRACNHFESRGPETHQQAAGTQEWTQHLCGTSVYCEIMLAPPDTLPDAS